ncbi:MAG: methyltransferase domain-containing protein [Methanothrix sp.]|nr:methyltransferase domain-containing protein [Methanothrix sp.]
MWRSRSHRGGPEHIWDPAEYERNSRAQRDWAMAAIGQLRLKGSERVLDIGCGTGGVAAHLSGLVPEGAVVGLDLSREMISFARQRYPRERYKNLSFQVGDALHLRFHEEFDLVVSFACLHWIEDHLEVLRGVRRSLVPGGLLLLQCGGRGNAERLLEVTAEVMLEAPFSEHFCGFASPYYFYGPELYEEIVPLAGLILRRVELIPKDMVHQGRAGLEGFIRSTWLPYLERLPEELRPAFVSALAGRYLERHPADGDGSVHVSMVRLEAEAEKPAR